MKKHALIIDFDVELKEAQYKNYDLYVIGRHEGRLSSVEFNGDPLEDCDPSIERFVHSLQEKYEEVFCLFLTTSTLDVSDFAMRDRLIQRREPHQGKVFMYLIHYMSQPKDDVVKYVVEMYEAGHHTRDVLARIDKIRNKNMFSINQLIARYLSSNI